jgi:hypothetical protein
VHVRKVHQMVEKNRVSYHRVHIYSLKTRIQTPAQWDEWLHEHTTLSISHDWHFLRVYGRMRSQYYHPPQIHLRGYRHNNHHRRDQDISHLYVIVDLLPKLIEARVKGFH